MSEQTRALERLSWKRSGTDAVVGPNISREEELDSARVMLDGTLPLLIDRERARRDEDLTNAAALIADEIRAGRDIDDGLEGGTRTHFANRLHDAAAHDDRVQRLEAIADEAWATLSVSIKREPRPTVPVATTAISLTSPERPCRACRATPRPPAVWSATAGKWPWRHVWARLRASEPLGQWQPATAAWLLVPSIGAR